MLVQCWSTVYDGGPTLSQHWLCSSRINLLTLQSRHIHLLVGETPGKKVDIVPASRLCRASVGCVYTLLCQQMLTRRRRSGNPIQNVDGEMGTEASGSHPLILCPQINQEQYFSPGIFSRLLLDHALLPMTHNNYWAISKTISLL